MPNFAVNIDPNSDPATWDHIERQASLNWQPSKPPPEPEPEPYVLTAHEEQLFAGWVQPKCNRLLQDIELMSQYQDFGFQLPPRLEVQSCSDSPRSASQEDGKRMEFSEATGLEAAYNSGLVGP